MANIHGFKISLRLLNIVSSVASSIGILCRLTWIVKPIQEETNRLVAYLILLPIFLFRMSAWIIIIAALHSFSLIVFFGLAGVNLIILLWAQKEIEIEPLSHTFLSIIFPVPIIPSSKICSKNGLKILFFLGLTGNLILIGILALLFALYSYDLYNPWCGKVDNRLQLPEMLMNHSQYIGLALFASATIPLVICFLFKNLG